MACGSWAGTLWSLVFLSSYFTKKRGETLFSQWFPIVGAVERHPKKHFFVMVSI